MLILTRRIGESIVIGNDIYVTVCGVKGNQVRLGFDAPKDVIINRDEIHQRILREQSQQCLSVDNLLNKYKKLTNNNQHIH